MKQHLGIVLLCILVFSIQLGLSLQHPFFDDPKAYFHLEQIQNVAKTGKMLTFEAHSIYQKEILVAPAYYYVAGLFYAIAPYILTIKIIEALVIAGIIALVYALILQLGAPRIAGFFGAAAVGTFPLLYVDYLSSIMPQYMSLLCILVLTHLLLDADYLYQERKRAKHIRTIVLLIVIFSFVVALFGIPALFILLTLVFYAVLAFLNDLPIRRFLKEALGFFLVIIVSVFILLYRKGLLQHGPLTFWKNAPLQYMDVYVQSSSIISSLVLVNILLIIAGMYVLYKLIEDTDTLQTRRIFFYISGVFAAIALLLFRIGSPEFIFLIGGICMVVCISMYAHTRISYAVKNYSWKFSSMHYWVGAFGFLVLGVVFSLGLYVLLFASPQETVSPELVSALTWISVATPEHSLIIARADLGHPIGFFANRSYVLDTEFLFVPDVERDLIALKRVYTSIFLAPARAVINEYLQESNATTAYVIVDPLLPLYANITVPKFVNDTCFSREYSKNDIEVYKFTC